MDQGRDLSDTQVIMYSKTREGQEDWLEEDRTEVVLDNLNPDWLHKFPVTFNFGQKCDLKFEVVDVNADGSTDLIG